MMVFSILCWMFAVISAINGCFIVNKDTPGVIVLSPVLDESGKYPLNVNCSYTITEFMPHGMIYEFTKMDLELDDIWARCKSDALSDKSDWVAILDGGGNEVTRRCGGNLPSLKYRTLPGPGLIWFHSDSAKTYTGFSVRITADVGNINECFIIDKDTPGVLEISPILEKNGKYAHNVNCSYKITDFLPYGIIYEFTKMDLQLDDFWSRCKSEDITCHDQCDKNDWVSVVDGNGNELTRRCGGNLPVQKYRSPPGAGAIWFHTDKSSAYSGFTVRITADQDTIPCMSTTIVKQANGILSNHVTVDRKYRSNEDCKWKITLPNNFNTIKITITKMSVQGQCDGKDAMCNCDNDFVALYDGDSENAPLITKRCGFTAPFEPVYFTSPSKNPTAFVWFKTDGAEEFPGWQLTYEGYQWPDSKSLVAFWPLDSFNKLEDIGPQKLRCSKQCQGMMDDEDSEGPFGDRDTSYHSVGPGRPILTMDSLIKSTEKQSFTVAFFVRSPLDGEGGIMSFLNGQGIQTFGIDLVTTQEDALRPKLQVRGSDDKGEEVYGPYDVIWPEVWTFIAVVFDGYYCKLSIYGKYGELYSGAYKDKLCSTKAQVKHLRLGASTLDGQAFSLSSASSLSCVSIYSAALPFEEIAKIHEDCRLAHQSAPCGAPRLPLPAVPTDTMGIPAEGRFPYIASLRRSAVARQQLHVCSATILDAYHLMTAATCFAESKEPYDYSVIVGEHTLNKTENFERRHGVNRILVPDSYNSSYLNLALIELSSPIDFYDQYVNSICLSESIDIENKAGKAFFFGWGANGRPSGKSAAVPRYAGGSMTPCGPEWGTQHSKNYNTCFQSSVTTDVPCNGDEGGPLLAPANTFSAKNSRLVPIGIYGARFGNDCTKPVPAIFSKFEAQRIKSQIACNVPGFNYPDSCPISMA